MKFVYDSITTAEFQDFSETDDTTYFSDCLPARSKLLFSGSNVINSSEPYRQGVEIRSDRVYTAGTFRIHAGEKGHRVKTLVIGQDEDVNFLNNTTSYKDVETYDPIKFIGINPIEPPETFIYVSSNAQCTYDHGQLKNVIEPLSIRPAASLMSTYYPFEAHSVWGNMCGGNIFNNRSTDITSNHYDRNLLTIQPAFFDSVEIKDLPTINSGGEYLKGEGVLTPFIDEKLSEKLTVSVSGSIKSFCLGLEYNNNEIVRKDQKTSTCGYQYDKTIVGTDSLAFGGLTY